VGCKQCEVVPVTDIYLHGGKVWVLDGSDVLYIYEDHLSEKGALKVQSSLKQAVKRHFYYAARISNVYIGAKQPKNH